MASEEQQVSLNWLGKKLKTIKCVDRDFQAQTFVTKGGGCYFIKLNDL